MYPFKVRGLSYIGGWGLRYKTYRNILRHVKNFEKKCHYDDLFQKIGKNSQLMWNVINNLIRKSNDKSQITELQVNGMKLNKENDICNAFNEHFAKAGQRVGVLFLIENPRSHP